MEFFFLKFIEFFFKYPIMYPANTTCTFIIDGLQGEQNLEEVILTFETFAVLSETTDRLVKFK